MKGGVYRMLTRQQGTGKGEGRGTEPQVRGIFRVL